MPYLCACVYLPVIKLFSCDLHFFENHNLLTYSTNIAYTTNTSYTIKMAYNT